MECCEPPKSQTCFHFPQIGAKFAPRTIYKKNEKNSSKLDFAYTEQHWAFAFLLNLLFTSRHEKSRFGFFINLLSISFFRSFQWSTTMRMQTAQELSSQFAPNALYFFALLSSNVSHNLWLWILHFRAWYRSPSSPRKYTENVFHIFIFRCMWFLSFFVASS